MAVRRVFPMDGNSHCRLCDTFIERIEHVIKLLRDMGITGQFDDATRLLGCTPSAHDLTYTPLPNGPFSLLLILWKFIILGLTEVDTNNTK